MQYSVAVALASRNDATPRYCVFFIRKLRYVTFAKVVANLMPPLYYLNSTVSGAQGKMCRPCDATWSQGTEIKCSSIKTCRHIRGLCYLSNTTGLCLALKVITSVVVLF